MTTGTSNAPSVEAFDGSVLLKLGFRPFFLGAGVWACAASLLWLSAFHGHLSIPTAFGPIAWQRDFAAAEKRAEQQELPLLVLFQEVPG